ncbi:GH1 family beta-glucosidase [Actinotalea sp. M2MS4P-6]|uniref:GH1 family beta-glucosidase n=1 Tax=Actinotalea sp. M2MS4P-6 TaxID=2983762 RepID=UPI0021E3DA3A|nr:GH1 family beta-glucosidase [Actinotalea sp. M2MS4P-6]MCV2395860.1 GH1 family beta-glucosidase [Actinotalea sp. M2MS4P-6]
MSHPTTSSTTSSSSTATETASASEAPAGDTGAARFPTDFVWGAATSSYQIEGGVEEGGRTPSIWDTFCRVPGAIVAGDDGDVAADHYHRWPQDVALMADLSLNAYRFSVSWSRVMPEPGVVNPDGLAFYSDLVDALLEHGVTPWITLYHWDLPQWLEDRGGWTIREVVEHFVAYATAVHAALGDRVRHWLTLNEPWCSAFLGYSGGQHAPGRQEPQAAIDATHHLLLAHGQAVRALRAADPTATLGITLNFTVEDPVDPDDPADVASAALSQAMFNDVFVGPITGHGYPTEVIDAWAAVGVRVPVHKGDLDVIATPIDVLGVNYYHGNLIGATPPPPERTLPSAAATERPTGDPSVGLQAYTWSRDLPRTGMDWEVQPDGLRRLLVMLHTRFTGPLGIPLVITENGSAYPDTVGESGEVHDPERTAYLVDHLRAVHAALEEGADVQGYFVWSLLDNFEWAYGYDKRFGVVHVDFETMKRTPKTSARTFAVVARSGEVPAASSVQM